MPYITVFSNIKGGTGKTMTLFNESAYLSDRGYKVLCIDLDAQGNLTRAFLEDRPDKGLYEFLKDEATFDEILVQPYPDNETLKNIYLLPNTYDLFMFSEAEFDDDYTFLKNKMEKYHDDFDFILIDTNPSVSFALSNALVYANYIFGVVDASIDAMEGFIYLKNNVAPAIREIFNPNLKVIGLVLNENDKRRTISKKILEIMKENFQELMFDTVISVCVKTQESRIANMPIIIYDPKGVSNSQYALLTEEFIRRIFLQEALNG